jgi:hypothetical protein
MVRVVVSLLACLMICSCVSSVKPTPLVFVSRKLDGTFQVTVTTPTQNKTHSMDLDRTEALLREKSRESCAGDYEFVSVQGITTFTEGGEEGVTLEAVVQCNSAQSPN